MFENIHDNHNQDMARNTNESNMSEYTTPESTTSAQNMSQTETSTTTQFVRIPTGTNNPRQILPNSQSSLNSSPQRYITFEIPPSPTDEVENEIQNTTSIPNTSVNVLSPTRNNPLLQETYLVPHMILHQFHQKVYKFSNTTHQATTSRNNNQQTSHSYYDPFNYTFFPQSNTSITTHNQHQETFQNNSPNILTQHPYEHLLQTNPPQRNSPPQDQRSSSANFVQPAQRRSQNPPLTHISTDPLYQMNQHTTYNPTTISQPINTVKHIIPPPQCIPIQQDTFINTCASIPEPMKPFDGLDHSYTPEEYLQQVEARLTFAIGEEPQNNPVKYRPWHNQRMAYIQCSLIGTALDWYTNLHISYKQQWNSFVQLFKKQFSS